MGMQLALETKSKNFTHHFPAWFQRRSHGDVANIGKMFWAEVMQIIKDGFFCSDVIYVVLMTFMIKWLCPKAVRKSSCWLYRLVVCSVSADGG